MYEQINQRAAKIKAESSKNQVGYVHLFGTCYFLRSEFLVRRHLDVAVFEAIAFLLPY
jgi:hypothetical protein